MIFFIIWEVVVVIGCILFFLRATRKEGFQDKIREEHIQSAKEFLYHQISLEVSGRSHSAIIVFGKSGSMDSPSVSDEISEQMRSLKALIKLSSKMTGEEILTAKWIVEKYGVGATLAIMGEDEEIETKEE